MKLQDDVKTIIRTVLDDLTNRCQGTGSVGTDHVLTAADQIRGALDSDKGSSVVETPADAYVPADEPAQGAHSAPVESVPDPK